MSDKITPKREVYAIHGVEPEVLAYGMAKYSRSALPLRKAIAEISSQKAEDFLNTFYFKYGHRSIADLAHIPMAVENVSLLAAIEVVDEQRWDGQERSTRYQDFAKRLYYVPDSLNEAELAHYHRSIGMLFDAYDDTFRGALTEMRVKFPTPGDMKEEDAERTRRARAFDIARYCLPLATLTSVGQIVSARTLESQISRMAASEFNEVRDVARDLREAAIGPAYNPNSDVLEAIGGELRRASLATGDLSTASVARMTKWVDEPVRSAPTLLKHCEENIFLSKIANQAKYALEELGGKIQEHGENEGSCLVRCTILPSDSIDREIAATILYEHSHSSFQAIYRTLRDVHPSWVERFLEKILRGREQHDELPRAFRAAGGMIFDIYMDIGGMRDMHRHRRCTQVFQAYDAREWAVPEGASLPTEYKLTMHKARKNFEIMRMLEEVGSNSPATAAYLLPLGMKRRFLMKMDSAEVDYIAKLRTQPAGHITYRRVAWEMFKALERVAPGLSAGIRDRVTDPDSPLDFFNR